jgi:predicted DNA-binding protein
MPYQALKRKIARRFVSRSFRVPPKVDRRLALEARKLGMTKSSLIKFVLVKWYNKVRG